MAVIVIEDITDWSRGNILDSYSGGARFESWPGRWLY
jgi:hypothetical protein